MRPRVSAARPAFVELQRVGGADPPGGVEHGVGGDPLAALEVRDGAVVVPLDRDHLLAEAERDADVAQVVLERLGDLVVAEVEQAVALLDHGDLGAERGEHRRVLDADHAAADDDERARQVRQLQDAVRVEHACESSNSTVFGRFGRVPTAITMLSRRDRGAPRCRRVDRRPCAGRRSARRRGASGRGCARAGCGRRRSRAGSRPACARRDRRS